VRATGQDGTGRPDGGAPAAAARRLWWSWSRRGGRSLSHRLDLGKWRAAAASEGKRGLRFFNIFGGLYG
jgi:hypothetical protein